MEQVTLNARVDAKDKSEFDARCSKVGLNTSTAINMFENDTTASAIEEGRKMMSDPSSPRYSSMEAVKQALKI